MRRRDPGGAIRAESKGLVHGRARVLVGFLTVVVHLAVAAHPPVRARARRDRVHGHDERGVVTLARAVLARAPRLAALRKRRRPVAAKALRREEGVAAVLAPRRQQRHSHEQPPMMTCSSSGSRRVLRRRRRCRRRSARLAAAVRRHGGARFERVAGVVVVRSVALEARRRFFDRPGRPGERRRSPGAGAGPSLSRRQIVW